MSQDVLQMKMDQIVERYPSVQCIHDDLCIYGKSEKGHNINLLNLMQVASNNSLVFNSRKYQIKHPQITFYGTIFNKECMKPDPEKIQGIMKCPPQMYNYTNFLGMVNFMQP